MLCVVVSVSVCFRRRHQGCFKMELAVKPQELFHTDSSMQGGNSWKVEVTRLEAQLCLWDVL